MKKITGSLPFRLLLGVILGIIVGQLAGSGLMHVVVTIKYILNQVIVFCVPLIIIGFIAPSITRLGNNASKMLGVAIIIAYVSSIGAAMERLYSHFCYYKLDVDRMQAAANMLEGEHDFKSFCSVRTQVTDTVRTVYRIDVTRNADDIITIRVTGNGFLYNMVRIIAGTLMAVGTGHIQAEDVPSILEAKDRRAAGPTAPARGLTLIEMKYEL